MPCSTDLSLKHPRSEDLPRMSLLKIPFFFAGALGTYATLTSPQPKVRATERPKDIGMYERVFSTLVSLYTPCFKVMGHIDLVYMSATNITFQHLVSLGAVVESSVILAGRHPSHPASQRILATLVRGPPSLASDIGISPMFLLGCGLTVVGGFIRYQCYRTLNRFFTFEVVVRDDHQLITRGPYSYVRHPSYIAALVPMIGTGICYTCSGSWIKECHGLETPLGKLVAGLYVAFSLLTAAIIFTRVPLEDALLKNRFGKEWDDWAKRVPYRLIPYVY